jgi:hypothetical protein
MPGGFCIALNVSCCLPDAKISRSKFEAVSLRESATKQMNGVSNADVVICQEGFRK